MSFLNLAFYKFLDLPEASLPGLRERLRAYGSAHGLKGTLLLSTEGLNGFLAGPVAETRGFLALLAQEIPNLGRLEAKESFSATQPFKRMLVKIKKEIISMGCPEIRPARATGPRVSPRELKRWLDQGRPVVFLDTRNDYEVRLGTFRNATGEKALDLELKTFRQFPRAVRALPADLKDKTVVSFCTGGIRCEKASQLLVEEGFKDVYQLDGGILRYFEEVGASYFEGECFVFDYRVALDPALRPTGAVLCYSCQNPVTVEEQKLSSYVPEVSCPHCLGQPKFHKERIAQEM